MSDDKTKKDFRDRDRINPKEIYEIDYWSNALGVSEDELRKALAEVGPMVSKVKEWLQNKGTGKKGKA
jgi:hypothetical protein